MKEKVIGELRCTCIQHKTQSGTTFPTLKCELLVNDEVKQVGYLQPFRKYSFQVSGNKYGEWDFGSTPVFAPDIRLWVKDVPTFTAAQNVTMKESIIASQCYTALVEWSLSSYSVDYDTHSTIVWNMPSFYSPFGENAKHFRKFVKQSILYLWPDQEYYRPEEKERIWNFNDFND